MMHEKILTAVGKVAPKILVKATEVFQQEALYIEYQGQILILD